MINALKKVRPIVLICVCLPVAAIAGEFTYSARVIRTEPIQVEQIINEPAPGCYQRKPTGFKEVLAWDIDCSLPRTIRLTRYRVRYAVDDREFSTVVASAPGEYIPVRLQLF